MDNLDVVPTAGWDVQIRVTFWLLDKFGRTIGTNDPKATCRTRDYFSESTASRRRNSGSVATATDLSMLPTASKHPPRNRGIRGSGRWINSPSPTCAKASSTPNTMIATHGNTLRNTYNFPIANN